MSEIRMIKKGLIILLMLAAGWGVGSFYKKPFVPKDEPIEECDCISRYDLYNCEDSILKYGDLDKLDTLSRLCYLERYPYLIAAYDVHHRNVSYELHSSYLRNTGSWYWHYTKVLKPMGYFAKSVLTEYAEAGDKKAQWQLEELNKHEWY